MYCLYVVGLGHVCRALHDDGRTLCTAGSGVIVGNGSQGIEGMVLVLTGGLLCCLLQLCCAATYAWENGDRPSEAIGGGGRR